MPINHVVLSKLILLGYRKVHLDQTIFLIRKYLTPVAFSETNTTRRNPVVTIPAQNESRLCSSLDNLEHRKKLSSTVWSNLHSQVGVLTKQCFST